MSAIFHGQRSRSVSGCETYPLYVYSSMKKKSQHIRLTPKVVYEVFSGPRMEQYAISYVRVSSESQVEGFSLDIQLKECREHAKRLDVEILKEFIEEGVSGTLVDRPALAQALAFCAKNKGKVAYFIVKDIDRIARDTLVHAMIRAKLRELGVQLCSINQPSIGEDSPHARFMENIFSSVAQLEREQINQRTVAGQHEAREQGAWIHSPPYGYETDRTTTNIATLKLHPENAPVVRKMFELYAEGLEQYVVCERIDALGHRTSRNKKFSKQTVSYMLWNPVYVGKIQDPRNPERLIEGLHPPIVSFDIWNRVQARLQRHSPFPQKTRANPHFPLVNVLRCHICRGPMSGSFSTGKARKRYGYYHCRKSGCKSKNIPFEGIERQFELALKHVQPTEVCVQKFEEDFITVHREKWQQSLTEKTVLQRRLTDLETKRDAIEDKFIMGKIDDETYKRQLEKAEKDILRVSEAKENHVLSEERMKEDLLF